ncbi:hypothetical protein WN51_07479 [Melipona quadrifasciata]|uniref:Uncharacterized protein n=1 Tax=Melipona quadrifasciata TaxID=166423 RepID=A0A0N0BJ50_9HYME|nr:hypothetical protein WN51_07479 [Melipona quadrifasciata]
MNSFLTDALTKEQEFRRDIADANALVVVAKWREEKEAQNPLREVCLRNERDTRQGQRLTTNGIRGVMRTEVSSTSTYAPLTPSAVNAAERDGAYSQDGCPTPSIASPIAVPVGAPASRRTEPAYIASQKRSKPDGSAISIVASSEPPHLGVDVLNFSDIFTKDFILWILVASTFGSFYD